MKNKNGQVAMEFFSSYGWAILAAVIVIGILAYYYFSTGAFNNAPASSYSCLSETFCINQNMGYLDYYDNKITCKESVDNGYKLNEFIIDWEELNSIYTNCLQ